ncbi:hypothetical protein EDD21DRAFT_390973 [Dissophora ornata]|nr:hypothetical protein EDD21DRAFT_390973 [Dissophora ornata]
MLLKEKAQVQLCPLLWLLLCQAKLSFQQSNLGYSPIPSQHLGRHDHLLLVCWNAFHAPEVRTERLSKRLKQSRWLVPRLGRGYYSKSE